MGKKKKVPRDPIFRGFIGGAAFITKLGYRGTSLDSLWVQNLFYSFINDDDELAEIALKSSLADLSDVVVGGEFGCPYSIAEHGFYAENQFEEQALLLKETERSNAKSNFFLSDAEWNKVDDYLDYTSRFTNAEFKFVLRGDTLGCLAIKKNAFRVAICLLNHGLDPVVQNEAGCDLFNILQQQYNHLTLKWKAMAANVLDLQKRAALKSEVDAAEKQEQEILHALDEIVVFAEVLKANLQQRLVNIANDQSLQRRCELLNEVFDPHKAWNIQQRERVLSDIQGIEDLNLFVKERINFSRQQQSTRRKLRIHSATSTLATANMLAQSRQKTAERGLTGFLPSISDSGSVSSSRKSRSEKKNDIEGEDAVLDTTPQLLIGNGDDDNVSLRSLVQLPPIKEIDQETASNATRSTKGTNTLRRGRSTRSSVTDNSNSEHGDNHIEDQADGENGMAEGPYYDSKARLVLRDMSEVHVQYR